MKKILSFLFGVIFLATIVTTRVSADQELIQVLQVNQSNIKAGQEIIVTLSLENNINKVDSYSGQFIYDKELFEGINESNFITIGNWEELKYNPSNNKFIMINSIGSSEKESILQVKLIAKKDINIEPKDISLEGVEASAGDEDISLKDENIELEDTIFPGEDVDSGGTEETPNNPDSGIQDVVIGEDSSNSESGENNFIEENQSTQGTKDNNETTEDSKDLTSIVQTGESSLALTCLVMAISIVILIILIKNKKITKKDYKKICIFLVFTLAVATSGKIYASYLSNGEITGDNKVDYDDIRLLQKHLIGLSDIKEEYLKNADLNNDNKITITDLSLLLKLVDKRTEYKSEISSISDKYYFEKGKSIEFKFNANVTPKGTIDSVIVNGDEYKVKQLENSKQYSIKINSYDKAGIYKLNFTKVKLFGNKEIKVDFTQKIEVLKDKISVDGLSIVDDYYNNKEKVYFNIIDKDRAFVSGKAQLISNNKVLQEFNIKVGENNLSFDVEEGVSYKFKVVTTYNRDEDGTKKVENEELINQDIQMIFDYKISTSNLTTYDNDGKQASYIDRNSNFKLRFESNNSTKFLPQKAIINSKEYTLTSIGTNLYEATLDGFSSSGVKSIKIEKLIMNNTKELEITGNNTTKVEVLKLKPTSNNFSYEELSNNSVKVNFDIVDKENSIKNSKVVVSDGSKTIFTKDNLTVGKNEIEFKLNSSETYTVKVTATYDLDSNILPNSDNEFEEEILNESITISKDAIEFKDIENIKLYKNDNDKIVEVNEVDVNSFNPKEYLAEVNMKDLPKLYAEIKESKVENGNLVLTLNYNNVVQYSDNNKKNKSLEVVFGKVNDKNIATNSTATNTGTKEDSTDIYIPEVDRLSTMEGYDSNKVMIYHNIYELMPFYDSSLIVEYGNNISEDSILNKSKIKMILPYDEDGSMIASINTNNYSKIKKLKVIFEDESTKDYSVTFDKKLSDIAVYNIDELNVKYNYNNYILDANNDLINTIVTKAKALDYKEGISLVTSEEESRIYVDYYNEYVKDTLDQVVLDLLSNIPEYNLYLDNEILKQKVEQDITQNNQLEKLIYTYNYFDKWYNFKMGGASLTDVIFININSLNKNKSILDLVEGTINAGETNRKTENAYKFYESVMKDTYALGKENIGTFLEYFMKVLDGYSNGADWFTDHFAGMLEETQPLENMPLVTHRGWDFLKRRTNLLLPVLSAPKQQDIYMICTPSQMAIGSLNRYTAYLNGNITSIRNTMKEYANNMYSYYKTSSAFINNSEGILKNICQVQFDTKRNFPNGLGDQEKGKTEDSVIKWVYEAANTCGVEHMDKVSAEAYADTSTSVYWLKGTILEGGNKSFSTFTHESAHNLDSRYFYEGVDRRKGTGYEDSADGLLTQTDITSSLVFNLTKDRSITSDTVTNLKPERIAGKDKIYSYYKGMFDTTYVLDYLTAKAFLKLTPEEQAAIGVQVKYSNGESLDEGGSKLGYYRITAAEFKALNLQTIDDLIDNGIALRDGGSDATGGSYGEDNFYSVYWYQPHDNDGNAPTKAFKRLAFEMLGVGGYTDGFVTFVSNKSDNDLDALRKITKDQTITWKQYKLNRYNEIESKLDSIPYFNADDVVEAYYNAMKKDAQVFDSRDNVNNLRLSLYGIVKRATKDFTTGDIYGSSETIEISTAEQFVEELSKNTWGSYSITSDLDFSNINVDKTYVTNRFIGQIDGNGHKFKGLKKPLFNEIVYGELQDITIEGLSYESSTAATIGLTTKNLVLSNVVAENMLINIPFAKTNNGNYLELGSTAIRTSENVINTVEDLKKVGSDEASRKKSYIINANIDCSSITTGDSIISGVFSGNIDGNGYTLSNLKLPLFNNLQGSVKNLKIDGMTYTNTSASYIGSLAKQAYNATVEHVYLNNITISARENIGSLIGYIETTNISYVDANAINITGGSVTNGFYTGGLIGRSVTSNMKNISVKGDVTICSTHNGGLVGAIKAPNGTFENIFVNVNISRPQNTDNRNRNGGIFGEIESFPTGLDGMSKRPVFKNCISVGNMDSSVYKIGGGVSSSTSEGALVYNSANHINVYENQNSTGKGNVGSGSNIKEASITTLQSKGFYTGTLGWTEDIWDFSDMINGPSIK